MTKTMMIAPKILRRDQIKRDMFSKAKLLEVVIAPNPPRGSATTLKKVATAPNKEPVMLMRQEKGFYRKSGVCVSIV